MSKKLGHRSRNREADKKPESPESESEIGVEKLHHGVELGSQVKKKKTETRATGDVKCSV